MAKKVFKNNQLINLVQRAQYLRPLEVTYLRCCTFLSPHNMIGNNEAAIVKFEKLVCKLYNYQHLNLVGADMRKL